ncbi:MAG TPA: hypothetical protein VL749_05815 [Patescibacteria group bacterium]|nr:hypothetical protein [Patescibacteria group bacterium]
MSADLFARRQRVARYVGLFPRAWRERYGDELADVLESEPFGLRTRLDLLRSAIDARLHPPLPSPLPVVAALVASALAAAHAFALAAQPVATDWPGYLDDALPLILLCVVALVPALIGLWLRLGDADGAIGRIGIVLAATGHVVWAVALAAAAAQVAYGALTAAAATVAMAGSAALGIALVGRGQVLLGVLLAGAGLAGVAPPGLGWTAFAAAWTGIAFLLVFEFAGRSSANRGPHLAG